MDMSEFYLYFWTIEYGWYYFRWVERGAEQICVWKRDDPASKGLLSVSMILWIKEFDETIVLKLAEETLETLFKFQLSKAKNKSEIAKANEGKVSKRNFCRNLMGVNFWEV